MLDIRYIRENKQEVIDRLSIREIDATEPIEKVLQVDEKRRSTQKELDANLSESNTIAKEIGTLFKEGKQEEANARKERSSFLKEANKTLHDQLQAAENELKELLYEIPNTPHQSVPKGKDPEQNELITEGGEKPNLESGSKPHWELGEQYDTLDFETGNKITGAGFPVYKGKGAKLQRALINFFLDEATKAGYQEIQPPLLVNEESGYGTGQLPDKEGQMYELIGEKLFLIPTAEVPITNIYRNEIVKSDDMPIKLCGYTPCFRKEAGSYGKDVRGLNRVHQFDKVEIVQIAHPDNSYELLDDMVNHVTGLLQKLNLPYRVLKLCGGDLGFTSAITYDMEVWSAAQEKWLEVSSVSNFETFQANRLKLRFKNEEGKTQLAHTLNGSALALPRIVAALMENNQSPEGIKLPESVVKYTGFDIIN